MFIASISIRRGIRKHLLRKDRNWYVKNNTTSAGALSIWCDDLSKWITYSKVSHPTCFYSAANETYSSSFLCCRPPPSISSQYIPVVSVTDDPRLITWDSTESVWFMAALHIIPRLSAATQWHSPRKSKTPWTHPHRLLQTPWTELNDNRVLVPEGYCCFLPEQKKERGSVNLGNSCQLKANEKPSLWGFPSRLTTPPSRVICCGLTPTSCSGHSPEVCRPGAVLWSLNSKHCIRSENIWQELGKSPKKVHSDANHKAGEVHGPSALDL